MANLFSTIPIEPRLPTYDELLSSGQVHLLSSRDLRLLLTEFDASARLLAGYSAQMANQWNETARPVLYRAMTFEEMPVPTPTMGVLTIDSAGRAPATPTALDLAGSEILLDPEVRNAVFDRGAFASFHLRYVRELEGLVERLATLVDDELAK